MTRRRLILLAFVAAAVSAGAWWHFRTPAAAEPDAAPAPSAEISTAAVQRAPLANSLPAFGDVQPQKTIGLSFAQAGQLLQLHVLPGQAVHAGDVLATLRTDPTVQATYTQAANAVRLARDEVNRQRELLRLQLATASQVETAQHQLDDALATQAAQQLAAADQRESTLRAPTDGTVLAIPVAQSDRLAAGAPVLQFGQTTGLRLTLWLEPDQAHAVRTGQRVHVDQPAFDAIVANVGRVVDPKTLLLPAQVALTAAQSTQLVAGQRVSASIELARSDAWIVPRTAVLSDAQGSYLYQIAGGKAHRVALTAVRDNGNLLGVEGPLDARLPVVVQGNYELQDGMAVRGAAR